MFSAISTPIVLRSDKSSSRNDKLKLDSLGLHGRDKEKQTLTKAFDELSPSTSSTSDATPGPRQQQLVLISGTSGTGKTKLAEILKAPSTEQGGLFVRGKFARNMINQPYSGIAIACAELCGAILDLRMHNPGKYSRFGEDITSALNTEMGLLVQVIPALEEIVDVPVQWTTPSSATSPSASNDSKSQILFAFRRFLRVVARLFSPLVITLDDLQWADTSSFDLLEAILADRQISRTMVIGVYRSNEVDANHRLSEYLEQLEEQKGKVDFSITRIKIDNLDINAVNGIIQKVLSCKDEARSTKLAEVCHKRTLGNPFFLLQFLSMLGQKNLLKMTRITKSWAWNLDEIEANTSASDNVVDLLKARMTDLPSKLSEMLRVAACLGATFEQGTLRCGLSRSIRDELEFEKALGDLQREGFLVKVSSLPPRYSFVHDKIHEAASDLTPESSRSMYRRGVGEVLFEELGEDRLASEIFVVVNLLNDIEPERLSHDSRLMLARLNHQASDRADMVSAFDSAARYAERGLAFLGDYVFAPDTYDLSVGLFTVGAKAEGATGNVERMEVYCMSVIKRDEIPLEEKFGVYNTWVDHLLRAEVNEAVTLCLDILDRLQCWLPESDELEDRLLRLTKTSTTEHVSSLGTMTDMTIPQVMHWLDRLFLGFYITGDNRVPLALLKSMELTLNFGICPYAPQALAQTGLILVGLTNDLQAASVYGELALELLVKSDTKAIAARTWFWVYSFVFSWTKPLREMFNPLLEAHETGLRTGDTTAICWSVVNFLQLSLYAGSKLDTLAVAFETFLSQMLAMKMNQAYSFMQPVHQTVLNLIGVDNDDDQTSLVGGALDDEELQACLNDPFFKPSICIHQCILLTYFGEHEKHATLFAGMGPDFIAEALTAAPENMINTFVNGLSCFAAARETGEEQYESLGDVCRQRIKTWANMGNPNVKHYEILLDAEYYALRNDHSMALDRYQAAIVGASNGGFIQDAALASERLAEFYIHIQGDVNEARNCILQSADYWQAWGALGKVRHLQAKFPGAFVIPHSAVEGSVVSML